MNRFLLCILCFFTFSFAAKADEMVVKFGPNNKYEANKEEAQETPIANKVEFTTVSEDVNDDVFTLPGLGSFTIAYSGEGDPKKCNISAGGSGGNAHLAMFDGYDLNFKFNDGITVTKMIFTAATKTYTIYLNPSTGESVVNKDDKTVTWTGNATSSLDFHVVQYASNQKQIRIMYIEITYTTGGSTSVDEIAADENAPVEYFNLQGVRVANPENGLYIRQQGTNVQKVLVK